MVPHAALLVGCMLLACRPGISPVQRMRRRQLRMVVRQGPEARASRFRIICLTGQQAVGMCCMQVAHGHVEGLCMCRTSALPPATDQAWPVAENSQAFFAGDAYF